MAINRYFKLFLNAGAASPLVINVNQYDRDELWHFTLFSETGEQYYPNAAAIVGKKNDGNLIANAATVDGRGYVNVTETEQMTAAPGVNHFELLIDGQIHGTANFIVLVEPSPTEGGVVSDSDLSLIQQAMDSISPSVIAQKVADWMDENLTPTTPVVDQSLTVQGAAADSKKVGDELSDLKSQIAQGGTLSHDVATALLNCFKKVVGKDDFDDAYSALSALLLTKNLVSISAVFNQGTNIIYDDDDLSYLNQYLTVTATFDDNSTAVITSYELSGSLDQAESTITVTYEGKTATFTVNVTLPVFDYLPSRDGLLSTFEGIRTYVNNESDWSESITQSGNLRVQGTNSANSAYYQFVFANVGGADGSHVHEGRIKAEVELYTFATTTGTNGIYSCVMKLSNGSNGLTFGQAKNGTNANLNISEANTRKTVKSIPVGEYWHVYDLRYNDTDPIQKGTIDGENLFSSSTLSTYSTTSSCIMGVGNPLFFVKWLKVYNKYRGD